MRALRAVAAVAGAGGVSQAALALHQSPSAVTRAVQGAEQALGVKLFERGARGRVPTAAGEVLALRLARALQALQAAALGLRARGAPPSVASLPRLVSDTLLQALVARAAHPTEAAAAAAVGLSQPALHQALRRLEHAAKTPLYERTRLGAPLNESGEWLLQQVKVALAEIHIGHEELARWRGQGESQVAIGALPMASDVLVPQAVAQALAERPELRIAVKDGTYESLTRLLRNADVDFLVGPLRGEGPVVTLRAHSTAVVRSVLLAGDQVALLSPLHVRAEVQAGLLAYASAPLPGSERVVGITQRRDALASSACAGVLAALRRVAADAQATLPRGIIAP